MSLHFLLFSLWTNVDTETEIDLLIGMCWLNADIHCTQIKLQADLWSHFFYWLHFVGYYLGRENCWSWWGLGNIQGWESISDAETEGGELNPSYLSTVSHPMSLNLDLTVDIKIIAACWLITQRGLFFFPMCKMSLIIHSHRCQIVCRNPGKKKSFFWGDYYDNPIRIGTSNRCSTRN